MNLSTTTRRILWSSLLFGRAPAPAIPKTVELPFQRCLALHSRHKMVVHCRRGQLWVTWLDNPYDLFVSAGSMLNIPPDKDVVIQALEPARFDIHEIPLL